MHTAAALLLTLLSGCGLLLDDPRYGDGAEDGGADGSRLDASVGDGAPSDAPPPPTDATGDVPVTPTPACGGPTALTDDFDDGSISNLWGSQGSVRETGTMEATVRSTTASLYYSRFTYELRGDWVAVRIADAPAGTTAWLKIMADDTSLAVVSIEDAARIALRAAGGMDETIPYDPVEHQWIAIGESGGMLELKTSRDGSDWTTHRVVAAPSPLPPVRFELGGYSTSGAEATVRFDDFNLDGARPLESICKADQLDTTERHRFWIGDVYDSERNPGCVVTGPSGGMTLAIESASSDTTCEYVTTQAFDIYDRWLTVELESRTLVPTGFVYLALVDPQYTKILAQLGDTWGWVGARFLGGTSFDHTVSGVLATHMRLGHFGGEMRLETSLDGVDWRRQAALPLPSSFDPGAVSLAVGVDSASGTTNRNEAVVVTFRATP